MTAPLVRLHHSLCRSLQTHILRHRRACFTSLTCSDCQMKIREVTYPVACAQEHLCLDKLPLLHKTLVRQIVSAPTTVQEEKQLSASEVLQNLDAEMSRKLKVLEMEYEVWKEMNESVPEKLSPEQWVALLQCPSYSQRKKYLHYLRKTETYIKAEEIRKGKNRLKHEQLLAERRAKGDLGTKNTIFMMVRSETMNAFYNSRLAHAMQFGPTVILDMDYEGFMQSQECLRVVSQFCIAHGNNKLHEEPFHLHLTGLNPKGKIKSRMVTFIDNLMVTYTEKSYLDIYPRDRLVYLTSNAATELDSFNEDDIYIVGGFVDKTVNKPISMARAKEQGLRMAKFPIDRHVLWSKGTKNLTIDQVIQILLTLKDTKDWKKAFAHLPSRKLHH